MFRRLGLSAALMLSLAPIAVRATDSPHALLVCSGSTFKCPAGTQFKTIQAAVDATSPGDWVLVWPGVYHEKGRPSTGVLISKPDIHLRGLNRNLVIVDGSNSPAPIPVHPSPASRTSHRVTGSRSSRSVVTPSRT